MQKCFKYQIQKDQFEYRFLETDGYGSFSSFAVTNANVRGDDGLFIYSAKPPIKRQKLVQKFDEIIEIDGHKFELSSQTYVNDKRNTDAKNNFLKFESEYTSKFAFQCLDVTIEKSLVYSNQTRQVALVYNVSNPFNRSIKYTITPQIAGHPLGEYKSQEQYDYKQQFGKMITSFESEVSANVYIKSNLPYHSTEQKVINDYYYPHDARDGRDAIGSSASYGSYELLTDKDERFDFIISSNPSFEYSAQELIELEVMRKKQIVEVSNGTSSFAKNLALATDNYLVHRESTDHKTIIAGYPFFGDWGRDTFWAFNGICLETNRFDQAKSILKSFVKYEKNGLLPNMFPEGDEYPFYNSVDAPLLFINSLYEYYQASKDRDFVREISDTVAQIISNYIEGTDYHIFMDEDGLIQSGADLEQLTWMDVRFETILPTPRQGKCVEINAMWYNALKIVISLSRELNLDILKQYNLDELSEKVFASFRSKFITSSGYLLDVISETDQDQQIRSNQIWVISQNFTPLTLSEMKKVIKVSSEHLFAGAGIRTLSPTDRAFKPIYGDSHYERDMAYHQGTVWPFILGGYIRAYLKSEEYSAKAKEDAKKLLEHAEQSLNEYCLGQICEVMDGLNPSNSKGCYAQAWSIAEIYRALCEIERG